MDDRQAPQDEAPPHEDRADRLARRFAVPVLIAALASVPAVFLTLLDDPWETVGTGLNTVSGVVLVTETIVLFAVAEDRRGWLRRNWWLVGLAALIVPAVLFAVGPVQLLRLVRVVGALRIIRIGRILKAGRIVRERTGLTRGWQRVIGVGATLLCAAFVGVVLADPSSTTRQQVVDPVLEVVGLPGVVLAGLLLAAATYIVRANRGSTHGDDRDGGSVPAAGDRHDDASDRHAAGGTTWRSRERAGPG